MIRGPIRSAAGYGKRRSQWFFRKLYFHAIYGMNYASPDHRANGELAAMRYVRDRVGRGDAVLFDVGANVGDYSLELRQCFGPAARIFAFEPAPTTYAQLQQTAASLAPMRTFNFGLSKAAATCELFTPAAGATIASVYQMRADHPWATRATEPIELRTLDEACAAEGIEAIDFLKIDVEGAEIDVLQGGRSMLDRGAVHFIQFEFGFRQVDSRTFFRDFFDLLGKQYRISRIVADGLCPLPKYGEELEVFYGVSNYLAERR
jgi:FkbM family methyltransferase